MPDQVAVGARIVVGVDGSGRSARALRWAHHLSAPLGTGIDAVHAWEKPPPYVSPIADQNWDPATAARDMVARLVVDTLGADAAGAVRVITVEDNPVRALLARSRGAYLLVVGSRGHGGVTGLFLGSVSARCAEQAECAVLVVHDSDPPSS